MQTHTESEQRHCNVSISVRQMICRQLDRACHSRGEDQDAVLAVRGSQPPQHPDLSPSSSIINGDTCRQTYIPKAIKAVQQCFKIMFCFSCLGSALFRHLTSVLVCAAVDGSPRGRRMTQQSHPLAHHPMTPAGPWHQGNI